MGQYLSRFIGMVKVMINLKQTSLWEFSQSWILHNDTFNVLISGVFYFL